MSAGAPHLTARVTAFARVRRPRDETRIETIRLPRAVRELSPKLVSKRLCSPHQALGRDRKGDPSPVTRAIPATKARLCASIHKQVAPFR